MLSSALKGQQQGLPLIEAFNAALVFRRANPTPHVRRHPLDLDICIALFSSFLSPLLSSSLFDN